MTPTTENYFIRIHLSRGKIETKKIKIDDEIFSFKGYVYDNQPSGAGTFKRIIKKTVENKKTFIYVSHKGFFKGNYVLPGKGIFSLSNSDSKYHYEKHVIIEKHELISNALRHHVKQWIEERSLLGLQ